ncbi:hypothetical protein BT93_I0192 [Corymbia citriodora subsp. variegata]|nr:hypothetical protein BT93_I0192 [Corymbia citriodora subsp. variegata]
MHLPWFLVAAEWIEAFYGLDCAFRLAVWSSSS